MRALSTALVPVAAALVLVASEARQDARPPSAREQSKLVEEYLSLDRRSPEGFARGREILARLDEVPPLSASEARSWAKKIHKAWSKGRKLKKKSGRVYWWEDEERGMFIVGGETKRPKGLLLSMHGGGQGSGDAWSAHGAYDPAASRLDWVAIHPEVLEKTEHGWTDSGTEEWVLDLIDAAMRTWKIDPDRVYFAGHSMGGYGTWTLGAHHADRVAGLAPSAGAPTPIIDASGTVVDIDDGVVPSLRNVPIVIYQSDDDPRVPPDANRAAVKKMEEARERWGGFDFEYWEVTGRAHDLPPGGTRAHLEKIADRERNARPDRVVWQPALAWKQQFYWLWWDEPVRRSTVVATLDREANAVEVTCSADPKGLALLLDDDLVDLDAELVVRLGEDEVYRGVPERRLSVLLRTAARGDPALTFEAAVPVAP